MCSRVCRDCRELGLDNGVLGPDQGSLDCVGSQDVSRTSFCSKHGQLWVWIRLLMAWPSPVLRDSKDGD